MSATGAESIGSSISSDSSGTERKKEDSAARDSAEEADGELLGESAETS